MNQEDIFLNVSGFNDTYSEFKECYEELFKEELPLYVMTEAEEKKSIFKKIIDKIIQIFKDLWAKIVKSYKSMRDKFRKMIGKNPSQSKDDTSDKKEEKEKQKDKPKEEKEKPKDKPKEFKTQSFEDFDKNMKDKDSKLVIGDDGIKFKKSKDKPKEEKPKEYKYVPSSEKMNFNYYPDFNLQNIRKLYDKAGSEKEKNTYYIMSKNALDYAKNKDISKLKMIRKNINIDKFSDFGIECEDINSDIMKQIKKPMSMHYKDMGKIIEELKKQSRYLSSSLQSELDSFMKDIEKEKNNPNLDKETIGLINGSAKAIRYKIHTQYKLIRHFYELSFDIVRLNHNVILTYEDTKKYYDKSKNESTSINLFLDIFNETF